MHVLDANEIFGVTAYTYDRIMEAGGKYGPDAFAVYFKLLEQTRIQQTNRTFTLNKFLENYFGWGNERVSRARKILKDLGLIDDIIGRDNGGKITGHYIRVNFLINEDRVRNACSTYNLTTTPENQDLVSSGTGEMETNALSTKYINAGNTKQKESVSDFQNNTSTSDEMVTPYQPSTRIIFSSDDLRDFAPYLDEFRNYWEETDSKGVPLWKKQKTRDTHRRLIRWKHNNDTNFGRNKPSIPMEDLKQCAVQYYFNMRSPDKQLKYKQYLEKYGVLDKWKELAESVLGPGFIS